MNGDNVLQSSPVQQLVATGGSPNQRWSPMTTTAPPPSSHRSLHLATVAPPPHFFLPQNEPPSSMHSWHHDDHNQEFQDSSLCQLLLSGLVGNEEDDKLGLTQMQKIKKLENWEEQLLHDDHQQLSANVHHDSMVVKQEALSFDSYGYGENNNEDELIGGHVKPRNCSHQNQMIQLISSCPNSCVITRNKAGAKPANYRSSESNSSSGSGGASKKAKVEPPSSNQSTFKVKKEKLGDRITALHQMVSPFGKTDTASVLLEVMGYIKFLEAQIQALSLPYFGVHLANMMHHEHSDCDEESRTNLKSVGLCLVPVSCTMQVGSDNGADYWAPTNNLQL
ncbi:hypothetical protein OSB04_031431 [Centaurea solstitialis]|uniref:BHLH domain-containing protein n=1 Tax=Centaurea solstitialis TaxID=347529 RepID=A0AA38SH09_9ASTR|nr:hypothetical protein OSB04_031431 [Centaurea solstitialis]